MRQASGRLVEIWLEGGKTGGRMACPPEIAPAPGQYLLASPAPSSWLAVARMDALPVPLFTAGNLDDGLRLAPPLPPAWQPGQELILRGPLGRGFQLPPYARHLALAALDVTPARLLPTMTQALAAGSEVTLFCDLAGQDLFWQDLPDEVEVDALGAFPGALPWADVIFLDLAGPALPDLRQRLGLQAGQRIPCPAQALVQVPMPCAGLADCGVCAVPLRGSRGSRASWALACKDGPVFDLDVLDW